MTISIDKKGFTKRSSSIRRLLVHLSDVAVDRANNSPRGSIILAASNGHTSSDQGYKAWRFKTKSSKYVGAYFEIWTEQTDIFTLEKAYFMLYLNNRLNNEVMALHSDLNESSLKYKTGPHIHINHPSDSVISGAHIALNLNNLNVITGSLEKFDEAFKEALIMINLEIISK